MREVQYRVSDDEYRDLCRGTGSDGQWETCERFDPDTGKWNDDDVAWDVMEGQIPSYRITAKEARQMTQGDGSVPAPKGKSSKAKKKSGRSIPPFVYAIIAGVVAAIIIVVVIINNSAGVSLTIPASLADADKTQADYDTQVKETSGIKSITVNDDGSVTYVLTKKYQKQMLKDLADDYTEQNNAMVGSEDYPNITEVTANDDFTNFTVKTTSESLSLAESFSTLLFYVEGGMYGAVSGVTPDNIHIDFVNANTGAIISSADSSKAGSSDGNNVASVDTSSSNEELQPLEIEEHAVCNSSLNTEGSDTRYIDYVGKITNPNTSVAIKYPKFQISIENEDGTVLATDYSTGTYIMPGDSVILSGTVSVPAANITSDTKVQYSVDGSDAVSAEGLDVPRTSELEITNVSEQNKDWNTAITGKITNNSTINCSMIQLDALFKKDGEIVGVDSTYVDDLAAGGTTAFEIDTLGDLPEHDTVEVYAQYWW